MAAMIRLFGRDVRTPGCTRTLLESILYSTSNSSAAVVALVEHSNNFINVITGLQTFSSRGPDRFHEWHNNTCVPPSMARGSVVNSFRRQTTPSTADDTTNDTLLQSKYDIYNQVIIAVIHLATQKPLSLLVDKYEDTFGLSGNG